MKRSSIILLSVAGILILAIFWGVSKYNGLVTKDEAVSGQWANVENQYQRRADLIPNLVATVKGYASHESETLEGVVAKVGADKVAWVYRQFPLEQLHQKAMPVALASECVAELGGDEAFWLFADRYFEDTLTNDRTNIEVLIPQLVAETGVNKQAFTTCFESEKHKGSVEADVADAVETGGRGTPWSVIVGPTGKTYPVNGALPANVIEQMIQKAIDEA